MTYLTALSSSLAERFRSLVAREGGFTLVTTLGVLFGFTISAATLVMYSTSSARSAGYSKQNTAAYALAEAGLNEAMSVLAKPGSNPLNPFLLPATTSTYTTGTATWSGTLDQSTGNWTVTSTGKTRNPTGPNPADIRSTLRMTVPVTPALVQPLSSPAWNYIYATRTGNACDMTLQQSVQVSSPLYVNGNLCMENTATIASGPMIVRGKLTMNQHANSVGSTSLPINEAHIGNGCQWLTTVQTPCVGGAAVNVFATTVDASPPVVAPPAADWNAWYLNASPGPYFPCAAATGLPTTGSWSTAFDSDQGPATSPDVTRRNNSVGTVFNLTPAGSYSCKTPGGELSWDTAARVLTVRGTIFIDGSATVNNGTVNTYNGQAALYLSGTFLAKNSKLCAVVSASDPNSCSKTDWDPNARMLVIAANGSGGQVPAGDSIQLVSSSFQGALYGTNAVDIDTTSQAYGPIVGSTVMIGQSTATSFPPISIVPVAMPGNPVVLAQVGRPQYAG